LWRALEIAGPVPAIEEQRTNKSLASFAGMLLVYALSRKTAKHVDARQQAIATIVGAGNLKRRKN
jgi:hypothetical protein